VRAGDHPPRRRAAAAASRQQVAQTVTEKELTSAKLSLLHAQVEPHFLYNTLASAQYLTRTDPALADQMLGNLITYLRTRCRAPIPSPRRWARK
jgi:LytS/YehU family sensor histidine kinase